MLTDDNISWVLKEVRDRELCRIYAYLTCSLPQGEHIIHVDRQVLGPSCGMLPVGIDSTMLTTEGLKWNLSA